MSLPNEDLTLLLPKANPPVPYLFCPEVSLLLDSLPDPLLTLRCRALSSGQYDWAFSKLMLRSSIFPFPLLVRNVPIVSQCLYLTVSSTAVWPPSRGPSLSGISLFGLPKVCLLNHFCRYKALWPSSLTLFPVYQDHQIISIPGQIINTWGFTSHGSSNYTALSLYHGHRHTTSTAVFQKQLYLQNQTLGRFSPQTVCQLMLLSYLPSLECHFDRNKILA